MTLLKRFVPPAFLSDFNSIPGQLEAWNLAVSSWFDAVVEIVGGGLKVQRLTARKCSAVSEVGALRFARSRSADVINGIPSCVILQSPLPSS